MPLRVDPYTLQLFVSVAREGSISRAALKEHIATSALSRRVADLEHALGVALLSRSPLGVVVTDAGRLVMERAQQIELGLEALVRDVHELQGVVTGRVRLYANASAVIGFLPERLSRFCATYPQVAVELEERLSSEVVRACLDDVSDIGIAAMDQVPSGLDNWKFADDPLQVIVPRGHELTKLDAVTFERFAAFPVVSVQHGGALDRLLRERSAQTRLPLRVVVTVNSFDGVCRMVQAGLGIAMVPLSAARAYAGSSLFELRPLQERWARRELKMMALRKEPRSAAVQAMLAFLQEHPNSG